DQAALHGQCEHRATHRTAGRDLVDARELEHDAAGLDVGDPPLRRALAGAHAGLGGLLGQRAVGVDVDPHLAASLDVPGHGDTSRLDLAVGDVVSLDRLDAEVAERQAGAALGGATPRGGVLLSVPDPSRPQHFAPPSL